MTEKFKAATIYGNRHYPRIVYGPKIENLPEVVRVELADGTQRDYFPESQERVAELESVFGHIHTSGEIKGWNADKCAECGLDIRDQIHTRLPR